MSILYNSKAISTLMLIILILISAILGALFSYLLVMSNYYNMPEDITLLVVEDVVFPIRDATGFNVTILNPSNSARDANITAIRLAVEGKSTILNITDTLPERLPFSLKIGTRLTFVCDERWGEFAGETVIIQPLGENISAVPFIYEIPEVELLPYSFDTSRSVDYFNLTVENSAESIINLTVSKIKVLADEIDVTPQLPVVLEPGQPATFQCDWKWENYINFTITIQTLEGYDVVYMPDVIPSVALYVQDITFDYRNTTYFNMTVESLDSSTADALVNKINLTLSDGDTFLLNTDFPADVNVSPIPIQPNETKEIRCLWDWDERRNETITLRIYTERGFSVPAKTETTPPEAVWNITMIAFDLDYLDRFYVNITNMPSSLFEINVTGIDLNQNPANISSSVVAAGEDIRFECVYNWTQYVGDNVTVTTHTEKYGSISRNLTIHPLKITGVVFSRFPTNNPYMNVTVHHSRFSITNSTVITIIVESASGTYQVDGSLTEPQISPNGYQVAVGTNETIVCPWSWLALQNEEVNITIQTAEGIQVSEGTRIIPLVP